MPLLFASLGATKSFAAVPAMWMLVRRFNGTVDRSDRCLHIDLIPYFNSAEPQSILSMTLPFY